MKIAPPHFDTPFDEPLTWTLPSPTACAGIALATRDDAATPVRAFRDAEDLWAAVSRDELSWSTTVFCARVVSTVGRHLVARCLPPSMNPPPTEGVWSAARIQRTLELVARDVHIEIAGRAAEALEAFGMLVAERSGLSLAMDDFAADPTARRKSVVDAEAQVIAIMREHADGQITDGERYNRTIDVWSEAGSRAHYALARAESPHDTLRVFLRSRLDLDDARPRGAIAVRAKASGELLERPQLHSVGEGLDPHESMMRWMEVRPRVLRDQERDEIARDLGNDLHEVLDEVHIVEHDCGAHGGRRWPVWRQLEGDLAANADALTGRVLATDVITYDGRTLAAAGTLVTARIAQAIGTARVPSVLVRDPIACESRDGVCARCVGLDPDDHTWLQVGDAIGARAAKRIAADSTQFGRRWFHIC